MTVSLVARRHGVATWRRLVVEGALTAAGSGEQVVPASDYRALQSQVSELRSGGRCQRGIGCLHAEHRVDQQRCVKAESRGDRRKEAGDAEVEPVDRDEPAAHKPRVFDSDGCDYPCGHPTSFPACRSRTTGTAIAWIRLPRCRGVR